FVFFFSSRRRHTRWPRDWSSDVCSSDLLRDAYWNPDSDEIFSERVFGVGWAVNIPVAARRVAALADQYADASRSLRGPKRKTSRSEERRVGKEGRVRGAKGNERKGDKIG